MLGACDRDGYWGWLAQMPLAKSFGIFWGAPEWVCWRSCGPNCCIWWPVGAPGTNGSVLEYGLAEGIRNLVVLTSRCGHWAGIRTHQQTWMRHCGAASEVEVLKE